MSTTVATRAAARPRRAIRLWPRLAAAEFLKLRKRRGLAWAVLLLMLGPQLIVFTTLAVLHAINPAAHGPAGGLENFQGSFEVFTALGGVAAILIGSTAGAGDLAAGVFRELVVTGRSRLALFAARVPAGLLLVSLFALASLVLSGTASIALAGHLDAPDAGSVFRSGAWGLLGLALAFVLALGVSSLVGSRSISIGILLGWQLIVSQLLLAIGFLGTAREGLASAALVRLRPDAVGGIGGEGVPMSLGAAVIVLVAWAVVPLAVGAWRTSTRDA